MDRGTMIILGLTFLVAIGLIIGGTFVTGEKFAGLEFWKDTDIRCLSNGHENLAQHIHPLLAIYVDGEPESIPANIGLNDDCMAELHTHDPDGMIHIETVEAEKIFTLPDFFTVWGSPIEREGYELTTTVDGAETEPSSVVLANDQHIELRYRSINGVKSQGVERPAGLPEGAVMEIE